MGIMAIFYITVVHSINGMAKRSYFACALYKNFQEEEGKKTACLGILLIPNSVQVISFSECSYFLGFLWL